MRSAHEAEQAVLGGVLLRNDSYGRCDGLTAAEFEFPQHRLLWEVIESTVGKGEHLHPVTMLDTHPDLAPFAMEVAAGTPGWAHVDSYAKMVREAAANRRLIHAGRSIALLGKDGTFAEAQRILAKAMPRCAAAIKNALAAVKLAFDAMHARFTRGTSLTGLPTGIPALDEHSGGLQPGLVYVLAGRPSMGKSLLAMQIARNVARTHRVLVFSLEMQAEQLVDRLVSAECGVPYERIAKPHLLEDGDWPRIEKAYGVLGQSRLLIDPDMMLDSATLDARARMVHMEEPLGLIVIDHLGLIDRPYKRSDAAEIGDVTRGCKRLAKELGVSILLLSQLNRGIEDRIEKAPTLRDLRDSGRIEEDADDVWMLHRDSYYRTGGEREEYTEHNIPKAELFIRKSRGTGTGKVHLLADLDRMRMLPGVKPTPEEIEAARPKKKEKGFQARYAPLPPRNPEPPLPLQRWPM